MLEFFKNERVTQISMIEIRGDKTRGKRTRGEKTGGEKFRGEQWPVSFEARGVKGPAKT